MSIVSQGRPSFEEAKSRVDAVAGWRHRIEILPGLVTPGTEDTATEVTRIRLPGDLRGRRVLDVGCSDGYYSFLCERRGATDIVAIDDESSLLIGGGNGFVVAHDLLGSSVDYRLRDVADLDPDQDGTFDLIIFLNVLYHLPDPLRSLRRLAAVANPGATLVLKTHFRQDVRVWWRGRCYGFDVDRRPKWWFFGQDELGGDPTNWWSPNRSGLESMLRASGWSDFDRLGRHGDRLYYHARRS